MTRAQVLRTTFGLGLVLAVVSVGAQAQSSQQATAAPQTTQKQRSKTHQAKQYNSEGERVFAQNCSRCHNAPDAFSPSIADTIARHMRVRAQLSAKDEEELLRFLNP